MQCFKKLPSSEYWGEGDFEGDLGCLWKTEKNVESCVAKRQMEKCGLRLNRNLLTYTSLSKTLESQKQEGDNE